MATDPLSDDPEIWKPIIGWPEYEVSNLGRIKRVAPRRNTRDRSNVGGIRKPTLSNGYAMVRLTRPGMSETISVHRAVAFAYLGPPPIEGMQVNHQDSDRSNPRLSNLEWVTRSENIQHGYDYGFCNAKGDRNGKSTLTESVVHEIRLSPNSTTKQVDELCARLGVSRATIIGIARGRQWRHLKTSGWTARSASHKPKKLTDNDVKNIRDSITGKRGEQSRIAERYGVSASTINGIVRGRKRMS